MVRLPTPEINRSGGRGEWQDRMTTPSMASPNCTAESRGTRFATLGACSDRLLRAVIASYRPSPRTPPDYRRIIGPTIGGFPHSRCPQVDRIGCTAQLPPDSAAQDQYCRDDSSF